MLAAKKGKTTVRSIQQLAGFLNFLCKAIVPGRVFTRRLYTYASSSLKPHHHVKIRPEIRADLTMWLTFLDHDSAYCRSFFEFESNFKSDQLDWYTDASLTLGCGGYCGENWFIVEWEDNFLELKNGPSINYLELYALTAGILLWVENYPNKNITLFCDNMSVVHMVNNASSRCKNCMILLRLITLQCLLHNTRVTVKHVEGVSNNFADLLSRLKYGQFCRLARKIGKKFNNKPTPLPDLIWPMNKVWSC